jgi:hypothetical protein
MRFGGLAEPILREVLAETFDGIVVGVRIDVKAETLSVGRTTAIVLLVNEAAINAANTKSLKVLPIDH